jgi:hypothetical protein
MAGIDLKPLMSLWKTRTARLPDGTPCQKQVLYFEPYAPGGMRPHSGDLRQAGPDNVLTPGKAGHGSSVDQGRKTLAQGKVPGWNHLRSASVLAASLHSASLFHTRRFKKNRTIKSV